MPINKPHDRIGTESPIEGVVSHRDTFEHPAKLRVPETEPEVDEGDLVAFDAIFPRRMWIVIFVTMLVMVAVSRAPHCYLTLPRHRAGDAAEQFDDSQSLERLVSEEAVVEDRGAKAGDQVAAKEERRIKPVDRAFANLVDYRADQAEKWQQPEGDDRGFVRGGFHWRSVKRFRRSVSIHKQK